LGLNLKEVMKMYENFKDDEYIKKLIEAKKKILLTMNDARTYQGIIIGMSPNSILFVDKFNQEIMFYINDIRRILVLNGNYKKGGQK